MEKSKLAPSISGIKRIAIRCRDYQRSIQEIEVILGPPSQQGTRKNGDTDTEYSWFSTTNCVLELYAGGSTQKQGISELVFACEQLPSNSDHDTTHYNCALTGRSHIEPRLALDWLDCGDSRFSIEAANMRPPASCNAKIKAVDHLVIFTNNAEKWLQRLGQKGLDIRLALEKNAPQWGGRMLFFRVGKFTLEIIEPEKRPEQDSFWGIALQTENIDTEVTKLLEQQVQLSHIREGRKPNTRVATIKSHFVDIPCLLIQQLANG